MNTFGGSVYGSPEVNIGILIIPPLLSVTGFPVVGNDGGKSAISLEDWSSKSLISSALRSEVSETIITLTLAPVPGNENINVSSLSTLESLLIPTMTLAEESSITNVPLWLFPIISEGVILVPNKLYCNVVPCGTFVVLMV